MLAVLTDEQEALQELAQRIAGTVAVRNPSDLGEVDRLGGWKRLVDAGALELRTRDGEAPVASGTDVRVVVEALAGSLAPLPFCSTSLAVDLLSLTGSADQLLESIASGVTGCGLALSADLSGLARRPEDRVIGWDVENATVAVALGPEADFVEVLTLEVDSSAIIASPLDPTRSIARLSWDSATSVGRVSRESLLRWEALALMVVSADAIGAMRQTLANAIAYSKERIAYGAPIGSFQALQHLMVDAYVDLQPAASLTSYAAWAVDELSPAEALLAARSAKAYTARVGLGVVESAMQVFGGVGVTSEHIAHHFNRRVMADRYLFGTEDSNFAKIADARLGTN